MTAPTMHAMALPAPATGMRGAVRDVLAMCRRNLIHIAREPAHRSDVTIQPVLFTFLFVYVFGSGIPIAGGSYAEFAMAGLLLMNLTTSSMGTAVGLTADLTTGLIDRLRTLPMWLPAVLAGRSIADLLTAVICTSIVAVVGLIVGWHPTTGPLEIAAGFGVALLFAYALSWVAACAGLLASGVESAQAFGFLVLFPMAFISNALVPTTGMPDWLRTIADWNPVSAVTAACRVLWGNPNPSAASQSWSMQHPVETALAWSIGLLLVAIPTAVILYRRRTTN
jgi:ABC transporter DrrB family efflux protein